MTRQNFEIKNSKIIEQFIELRKDPANTERRMNLSWSNWGFGRERLEDSAMRLEKNGIHFIELHGNRYGEDLGYKASETRRILDDHGISVAGVCGMVSPESELSSNKPHVTQRCIDYFRRNIEMCAEMGGDYVLFAPGAVGRPEKYDDNEAHRACDAIRILGDDFVSHNVRAGLEPVRAAEVSFCHTFAEAKAMIDEIDHPGVQHIAGDIYHMLAGEDHFGEAIVEYKEYMINLHLADSHRGALGLGVLDVDLMLMALYVAGYNVEGRYCTPEPLGAGGDPYPQMWGSPDASLLDPLVRLTASCFYGREQEILEADEAELRRE